VLRRRRSKNNNVPKSANPTTPPTTPPAIAPIFVVLAAEGEFKDPKGVDVELPVVRSVAGVVRNVVRSVVVGRTVDLGAAVDSGPPAPYFRT
jgi:hypothetical protein